MSADGITIRGYREDDKEECCHIWLELTEWHRQIYSDPSIGGEDPGYYFDQHVAKVRPHRIWVAESKEVVVGLVGLMENDEGLEIEPIVVKKE